MKTLLSVTSFLITFSVVFPLKAQVETAAQCYSDSLDGANTAIFVEQGKAILEQQLTLQPNDQD